ncbi:hypothetical protein [Siphonobacter sp. SORGH_AS_0500]|uniref:hypothetical protein n=1 Tax=Siphonobacter sp. SORGH_AS_0500 TaxID=1864824 RepID=UPI002862F04E|nr:hypothetical protein [Siphonobacter sp. SORGH_AS_0500]MDR6195195.1 site-specific DNA-cytosine methylase [Siphonobacter sp. SORGH_AS_0500]
MKVLIACEYSGKVRDAFLAKGHDAISCDILPTESPGPHYQGDVRDMLNQHWDLIIAHPPCTYFSNAGLHYLKTQPGRLQKLQKAFEFVKLIWNYKCSAVCIENPIGWLNTNWKKPDQIISPYHFGEPHIKKTYLWLRGIPELKHTNNIGKPNPLGFCIKSNGRRYNYYYHQSKSAKERARFFDCIAQAMADQWG